MGKLLRYLLVLVFFWTFLFLLQQTTFLFFDTERLAGIDAGAIGYSYLRALPMDLATACYLTLPVALCGLVLMFKEIRALRVGIRVFVVAMVLISSFIHVADIGLFAAWGTKVNHKALSYLVYPEEAMHGATGAPVAQLFVIFLAEAAIALILLSRIDHFRSFGAGKVWTKWSASLLVPALLFIGMRGGFQPFPIDRSWSYHSAHPILNLGALNGTWNVIVLLAEPPEITANPYAFMPKEEADRRFAALHARNDGVSQRILNTERPNIVLILLESWTADVVGALGGDSGVTPGFDRLAKDGLLFTNFYSTGFRTEQGLCATISSFPSQPKTTIIRQYGKFDRLPSFVNVLDSAGYRSTYYYAGDVAFANTRAYLEAMGFDKVHDENSFPIMRRTRWGAYDEELFAFHLKEAGNASPPFFHTVMTSTSHEPFDVPLDEGFPGSDQPQQYRNSVHYTDRTLAAFLDGSKKQPWYDSTLFIIVADHGHFLPHNRGSFAAERHRIPLLFTGGALRNELRGEQNATFGCHVDLAATLLAQLNLSLPRFIWSKDLFDASRPHFAFWTFDDGFGIADATQAQVYDNLSGLLLQRRDTSRSAREDNEQLLNGKALEQVLLDQYIKLSQ
ncbi:MAG: sulfatase-like hydrolase/transferase [Flavobacteriales bacterium]|nr:sulfatase-like hydrolase/transferase [Flavobacteriales bacterium]